MTELKLCNVCGTEEVIPARYLIGYRTCLKCGEVMAGKRKFTVVPMHKSNYVVISNKKELKGSTTKEVCMSNIWWWILWGRWHQLLFPMWTSYLIRVVRNMIIYGHPVTKRKVIEWILALVVTAGVGFLLAFVIINLLLGCETWDESLWTEYNSCLTCNTL